MAKWINSKSVNLQCCSKSSELWSLCLLKPRTWWSIIWPLNLYGNAATLKKVGIKCRIMARLVYADDATSMALPSGHAASTKALLYFTFFTSVMSWDGSRPVDDIDKRSIMVYSVEECCFLFWVINKSFCLQGKMEI